ncbi:MAG TPA: LysR family transcriptional regulator [Oligoflexia bacterium]|nr:LysR family transcriptional regulator [Oligoflexia bacterium]
MNKLNIFFVVMESKSFSDAAEKLNVSRSAISQAMAILESQIGYGLFLRKSQKIYPTQKAQHIFASLKDYQHSLALSLMYETKSEVNIKGMVKVGAYEDFAKTHLSRAVKKFQDLYPNIVLQFHFAAPSQLQTMLEDNRLDICFSIFPSQGVKSIATKKIYTEDLILITPKSFASECEQLNTLIELPIVDYFPKHVLFKRWLYQHYKKRKSKLNIKLFASSSEMVLQCVSDGIGIGVVPNYVYEKRRQSMLHVTKICPTQKSLKDFIWLNQHQDQYSSQAHQVFYQFMVRYFDSYIE